MTERIGFDTEIVAGPEVYNFERQPVDGVEAGILGGIAYAFCANRCPVRTRVEEKGLACPFIITEASQGDGSTWDPSDPGLKVLGDVARNTWVHCVEDVQNGGEPVILLDFQADF
jgi:hypothetical protein